MALPGFTAEASLGPTVQTYRVHGPRIVFGWPEVSQQQYMDGAEEELDDVGDVDSDAEDVEEDAAEEGM